MPLFSKEHRDRIAARGQEDARKRPADRRLPPGQILTEKWPVLHYGPVPTILRQQWKLEVWGLVANPRVYNWEEFNALGQVEEVSDIHCVTRWSRYDNRWTGVPVSKFIEQVQPLPEARYVLLHGWGGFTTNLPIEEFNDTDCLFAHSHDGKPLTAEHGAPMRVVVPKLYFWKSCKWVVGVQFLGEDEAGFWERNGYHMHGDPWIQERFSDG